ncbi:UNVERIFIED_ORG: hypothetical protein M2442_000145 [Methylorubrum zatmanii]|nr:hypothetical protein [Methylorubrum zatmanii]
MSLAMRDWMSPGPGRGEEPERERLQVCVHGYAQVVHHRLPDLRSEEGLQHADGRPDGGKADQAGREGSLQRHVASRERDVDDLPE